ncbi:MAG: glycosyltransferase family 4 protein, partial [Gammaproteobacteria bacterium]
FGACDLRAKPLCPKTLGKVVQPCAAVAEYWALSRADAVLTVSEPLRQHILEQGLESSRIHVLPNGVNASVFRPEPRDPDIRSRWGIGTELVLGFVGGLRPWHGVDILPVLLERLIDRYPRLRLVWVGEGPWRKRLESDLREKRLHRHAVFTGALTHTEIPPLIRQFDVALAPYPEFDHHFYFSPLKLFEYMGCGVPVIAAAAGQISQIVRHEETGLLYPPGNLDALTDYCDRLLGNPDERELLGKAGAEIIHAHYTWDHNASRVVDIAQRLRKGRY